MFWGVAVREKGNKTGLCCLQMFNAMELLLTVNMNIGLLKYDAV